MAPRSSALKREEVKEAARGLPDSRPRDNGWWTHRANDLDEGRASDDQIWERASARISPEPPMELDD